MIDEKILHEEIVKWCKAEIDRGNYKIDTVDMCAMVRNIIDRQPKVGEWIPCSERLPEDDKFVLVTYKRRDFVTNPTIVNIGWIKYGRWHCYTELYVLDTDVLAWMPLPEPYKEENNGQKYKSEEENA